MSETMENNQGNQEQLPVKRGRTEAERERRREYNRKYMAAYRAAGREKPRKPTKRRPRTDAEREQHRLYMRQYVAEHPEKAKLWRERWILRTAAKLQAQAEGAHDDGRD